MPTSDLRPPTPDTRLPTDSRGLFLRRAVLAPLCLCLVAGLHAVRVVACGQTQWKWGGFGMFSTVDSEAARFVRAFAITDEGELPLTIPSHLDKSIAELRAAPTQAQVAAMARRLASLHWRRPDERMVREAERWTREASTSPFAPRKDVLSQSESRLPLPAVGLNRALEAIPAAEPAEDRVPIRLVRIECWRLGLDRGTRNATEGVPYSAIEGVPKSATTLHGELIRQAVAEATP